MLTKRIIPCLDVKDGRTVKGIRFEGLRDAGDPVALASQYAKQGADELVFLDITATNQKRQTLVALVRDVARELDIPFTVGGGIGAVADVEALLLNGADKVSINSAALQRPELIDELARRFGSQCIVVAVDARHTAEAGWQVYTRAGTVATGRDAVAWCREAAERGAGELLLTSMSHDGTKDGFALDVTGAVCQAVSVPVIASGGAGKMVHFTDVFQQARADAGLAASVFHFGEIGIPDLKQHLRAAGVPVRI
ncbi:imidazole glycerol phosphate synthase subunit HisF [Hymenobacter latericus]|uniref:imidazole glycerol phosphate synthase subunit HisF n=1 Tax=Hymenobacter sp. YIM 151858-1 TaxID=2987688 RepID=UPI002227E4FE|nr:imidazole glycerol phosphate synthase subunit HisF [Hymenobacter sp. YIM 151858-1]UYZ60234.1 imidazole glycerol phosphate synthase subunit HisF [Hymenobacter sp. YIM 151858-1]